MELANTKKLVKFYAEKNALVAESKEKFANIMFEKVSKAMELVIDTKLSQMLKHSIEGQGLTLDNVIAHYEKNSSTRIVNEVNIKIPKSRYDQSFHESQVAKAITKWVSNKNSDINIAGGINFPNNNGIDVSFVDKSFLSNIFEPTKAVIGFKVLLDITGPTIAHLLKAVSAHAEKEVVSEVAGKKKSAKGPRTL